MVADFSRAHPLKRSGAPRTGTSRRCFDKAPDRERLRLTTGVNYSRSRIPELRLAAARLIRADRVAIGHSNEPVLAKTALSDEDPGVRSTAVDTFMDQNVLGMVAIKDEDPEVRAVAVRRLTDQGRSGQSGAPR